MSFNTYNGYAYYASLFQNEHKISGCPFIISESEDNLIFQILRDIEFSFTEVKDKEILIEIYAIKNTTHQQNAKKLLSYLNDKSNVDDIKVFNQFRIKLSDYLENTVQPLNLNIFPYNDKYFACNPSFTVSKKNMY